MNNNEWISVKKVVDRALRQIRKNNREYKPEVKTKSTKSSIPYCGCSYCNP
jgi:hypothetical protein